MVSNDTRKQIDIPVRLILSETGVAYFVNQGRKLSRFRLLDDKEEYGIRLVDFAPQTVQKMMLLGYVSKIETATADIAGSRHDLIDLSKLITYGMLYRQFDSVVYDALVSSEIVTRWNRRNIKNSIDFDTEINRGYLNRVLSRRQEALDRLRSRVCGRAFSEIDANSNATEDERRILRLTSAKYLDSLNPLVWFMLLAAQGTQPAEELVSVIRDQLAAYVSKTSITEYFGLMLIELLNVVRSEIAPEEEPGPVYLLWRLQHRRRSLGDRARMHLIVSNNRARFEEMRNAINLRANVEVKGKSLYDFYSEGTDLANSINLGLYYLSFLSEACRNQNIHLESFVNHDGAGRPLIHVSVLF